MKKLLILGVCLVLALSVFAVGCGDEETTDTTAAPTETTAAPTETTAAPTETTAAPTETTAAPTETTAAPTETTAAPSTGASRDPIEGVEPLELSLVGFLPDIPPGSDWHNDFINKIEEYSMGQMTVRFGGPEAIPAADAPAAAQRGTVDIVSIMSAYADAMVPCSSTIGRAEYNPMQLRAGNPAFKYYEDEFAKNGLKYLGASVSSEAHVQTVFYLGKEVNTLDDLKGLKIAATGGSNKAFIESVGATCIPIDFVDYFTSMERGTVDGYNIGIPGIQDFSLTPVTKAMLNEPFSSCGGMMLMNMDKWNSLTEKQKAVVTQAMINTEIDGAALFTRTVEKVVADNEAAGVKILTLSPEESKAFYIAYRDAMWAEDIARWPDVAPQLKEWLIDPTFHRAN